MDIRDEHVGVDCQLGLREGCQEMSNRTDWTYVEDMKDPIEVPLPSRNLIFDVRRVKESRGRIPFTPYDDLPLDLCHGSTIDRDIGK